MWGGYTLPSLKELPSARGTLAAPTHGGHLLFAGEATDPNLFMTADAAIASGCRAAAQALAVLAPRAHL
mgnify:CR=1 FL=1